MIALASTAFRTDFPMAAGPALRPNPLGRAQGKRTLSATQLHSTINEQLDYGFSTQSKNGKYGHEQEENSPGVYSLDRLPLLCVAW